MLSEISQAQKHKYCMTSLRGGIQRSQARRNREYHSYQWLEREGNEDMLVKGYGSREGCLSSRDLITTW